MTGKPGLSGRKTQPTTRTDASASGCLVAPDWLDGKAWELFFEVADILVKEYSAGEVDSHAVAIYADNLALFIELRDIERTIACGSREIIHPLWAIRSKALDIVLRYQKEFGMTPKARAALPLKLDVEQDEFSEYE
jgi:phage terminase small subunit